MFLNHFLKKTYPSLDWIQVEISSYCNAACIYCPHTAYRKNWQNKFLPMEVFQSLVPAFKKTRFLHLQGWGEPFTHPHFFDMLRLAKKVGCDVGTTTNGTLLREESLEKMVIEGLDILGFSLAGVDEKNDFIRKGNSIKRVLDCIDKTNALKDKYGTEKPRVHIAYMLLRSGLNDIEKLPEFLGNTGAEETVISSLSLVVNPAMEVESLLASGEEEYQDLKSRLFEVKRVSAKNGVNVHFHIVSPLSKGLHCSENIENAIVVGSDGGVSPCVMTQVPIQGENVYYFNGQKHGLKKMTFGNLYCDSLNNIWHRKGYKEFTRAFFRGNVPNICQNCHKRFIDTLEETG